MELFYNLEGLLREAPLHIIFNLSYYTCIREKAMQIITKTTILGISNRQISA